MRIQNYTVRVSVPTLDEFAEHYPRYGGLARGDGRFVFDLVMTPETFVAARTVTEALGLPAVSAIAKECYRLYDKRAGQISAEWNTIKQFTGAVICTLMEANGYKKTGRKLSVSVKHWNRGEFYKGPQGNDEPTAHP